MARVHPIQPSFNAGEFSPLMDARVDVAKYKSALKVCLNSFPLVQGAWTCRPGSYFVAPTKANGAARLIRFEFSTTQAYIIEIGNLYARFYKDHAAILTASPLTITGVTKANPGVLTYTGTDPANGDELEVAGVVGMTELNGRRFKVANVNAGANTFELQTVGGTNVNTSGYTAYVSDGTATPVYTLTTTYATADLFQIKFAQSADTLYIVHPSYPPRKMTRTGHAAWTISDIVFQDGPYLPINSTTTTLTLSGTTGSVTVTASAAVFTLVMDVGRLIRWKDPAGNWTWLTITAVASTTSATATISGPNASAGTATVNWRLGVWSATTGYPGAVCFNEDRLCFGGPTSYPQRIDMSNSGEYENMAPTNAAGTVGASNAIAVTLNASDVNVIRWLQDDEKGLLVGTVGGEWIVRAATTSEALSATNIAAKRSTTYGSANVQPLRAGKATLYLQRAARKLRELAYVFEVDGFRSPDLTTLAEHVTLGGLTQLAYQQETQSIVWGTRTDGVLTGFTYEREQDVLGWHRHIFGGYYDSAKTQHARVESVACIPAPDGTRDETWVVVNRYINGEQVRYVEYLKKPWERGDNQADAFFVDAGLSLNNTVAATLTPGTGATVADTTGVTFTAGSAVFASTDVNRYIHYDYDTTDDEGVVTHNRASAKITGYTSSTVVTATILSAWPALTAIASGGWRMSVTSVSGLWHLEGESVDILADGAVQPAKTVTNGTVAFSYPASKAAVGLGYYSDGQILRIDAGSQDGTSQGKLRRIIGVKMRFHDSLGVKIGSSFDNLTEKQFRTSSAPGGVAAPLVSGDLAWEFDGDYDRDGCICWRRYQPLPVNLLAIMPTFVVTDG